MHAGPADPGWQRSAALVALAALAVLVADGLVVARWTPAAPTALGGRTGFSPGAGLLSAPAQDVHRELDLVRDSGATWVRLDFDWSTIEAERGRLDWSHVDRVVGAARARGLDVLALPTYSPAWARAGGTSSHAPPRDPAAFARFVGAAVERYRPRGVRTWEIWNEPNIAPFWEPRPDVRAYARLLVAAAAAVHAADPGATVLSGGLAPADDGGVDGQVDPRTYVTALYAAGAGSALDGVAVHPYSFPALPSDTSTAAYNTFQKLEGVRAAMVAGGGEQARVWLTEVGAPTGSGPQAVSEQRQAAIVLDAVHSAAALPWTGPVFVYAIRDAGDDPVDREDNFGLVRRDFTAKPAWSVLRRALHARRQDATLRR